MGVVMPVAAKRLPPVLSFADLLRIEAVLQHVVQNTVEYSKAVWQSLTPEERAIMLEQYTIGVPTGGVVGRRPTRCRCSTASPTRCSGYFGNAAIMPFFIPATVSEEMGKTSRDVQEALLKFHRQAFLPPQSSITLPARGVLGEAVLGSLRIEREDRPHALLELAGLAAGHGHGSGRSWRPSSRAATSSSARPARQAPSGLQTGPMVTINQGPTAMTPADLGHGADQEPARDQPAAGPHRDHPAGAQMKVADRDDRREPEQDDRGSRGWPRRR